jgi:copper resistance protein D
VPVPAPRGGRRPRRRVVAALGWALAGAVGASAALAVAWFVLVTLRFDAPVARRSLAVARLDAVVASGRTADHVLSVATWTGYVAATLVLGALAFRTVVTRVPGRFPLVAVAGAGVGAALVSVPLRAAEVTGEGGSAFVDRVALDHVVTSTFGGAMALRAAGLLLVVASLGGAGRWLARWLSGLGRLAGAGLLVASYLVIGHAQASDPPVVEVAALAVHILAAATWFGGVAVLAADLRPGRRAGRLPATAVARFSRLAEVMVVLVIVSGVVLAEGQNLLVRAPWSTGYGRAFIAKLAFVAVVLAIGGYNRQRVVPAVAERHEAAARAHLRTTCVVESLVISMGVLLMTAAMTSGGF